jgi:plasmid stabilization system protein ParE
VAQSIIWSQEALDDIDSIAAFIAKDSVYHAQRVVEQLFELGDSITENYLLGREVPELGMEQIRERFLYSYRIIYENTPDNIQVLAVIHGRKLLESEPRFDNH